MTTPTLFPTRYKGTAYDYRIAKRDNNGAVRVEAEQIAVPSGTAIGTIIGLTPFQSGFKFDYSSTIIADALGAGVTLSLGYVFDDNVTFTNQNAGFLAATAANTANNRLVPNVPAGLLFRAVDFIPAGIGTQVYGNGWVVAVTAGAITSTTGNITCQINGAYDQP